VSDFSFIVVAIPACGALVIASAALRPGATGSTGSSERTAVLYRRIAGGFSVGTLLAVLGLSLAGRFLRLGTSVGANDCSASFALLTAAAWLPVISVARRSDSKRPALLYGLLLLLEASYLAIFACDDALWLCAALELNSVLLYLLMAGWSEQASDGLAKKMLLMNLAADAAILIGLMGVVIASARISGAEPNAIPRMIYSLSEIAREFPRVTTDDISAQEYWKHAQRSLLTILVLGAALKAPLVPFHAWFAAIVADGPPCVGIALVGPGLRVGLYLLARFIGPLCGDLGGVADLIVGLAVLGAFFQGLLTYGQANLKKMIACVCLLQGSLAVAGFFSLPSENASGPLMLALAGGVAGVLLLYALSFLEQRYGPQGLTNVGGIVHKLPNLAAVFLIAALSLVGIPGLFGFPSLFATLGAVFGGEWTLAFLAIGACLIGAWALFSMLQHLVFGSLRLPLPAEGDVLIDREFSKATPIGANDPPPPNWSGDATPRGWSIVNEGQSGSIDLGVRELLMLGPLLVSLVALGIWPQVISSALRFALIGSPLSH
jgi:NADH-quinone oxidoreductase subunit M